jgi:hypothetical protein
MAVHGKDWTRPVRIHEALDTVSPPAIHPVVVIVGVFVLVLWIMANGVFG